MTALAVGATQLTEPAKEQGWSAVPTFEPPELALPDPANNLRRDAAQSRASRSRAEARTAVQLRKATADASRRAGARAAAGDRAQRSAAAHQVEHDEAARAARDREAADVAPPRAAAPAAATARSPERNSDSGRGALAEAPDHAGEPYSYGASGPDSFDCSGFTSYLFGRQGTQLPRTARDQYAASSKVPQDAKQPGDLIFTYGSDGIYHVGIYAGSGSMWAATKSGDVVRRQDIWTSDYYVGRFT